MSFTNFPIPTKSVEGLNQDEKILLRSAIGRDNVAFIVAAADASDRIKRLADYVCDGTDDHVEIQAAVDATAADGGGDVFLSNGDYGDLSGVEVPASVRLVAQSSTGVVLSGAGVGTYAALDADGKIRADEFPDLIIAGLRQGTREELDNADPPLMIDEPAWETDTETFRVGNVRQTNDAHTANLSAIVATWGSHAADPASGFYLPMTTDAKLQVDSTARYVVVHGIGKLNVFVAEGVQVTAGKIDLTNARSLTELYLINSNFATLNIPDSPDLTTLDGGTGLTALDLSNNRKLQSLVLTGSPLAGELVLPTSLDDTGSRTFVINNNGFSASQLNDLMEALPSKGSASGVWSLDIKSQPSEGDTSGTTGCDTSIGTAKGWVVVTS